VTAVKIHDQRGGSAIEFAIVMSILFMLLFGIIEFSLLLYDKAVITNASREGARAGIVYAYPDRVTDTEIIGVVGNYCSDYLVTFGGSATPATSVSRSGTTAGSPLSVTVSYRYNFLVLPNWVSGITGGGIDLSAATVMRME
jgi:Flp pilus assembly protein TadG